MARAPASAPAPAPALASQLRGTRAQRGSLLRAVTATGAWRRAPRRRASLGDGVPRWRRCRPWSIRPRSARSLTPPPLARAPLSLARPHPPLTSPPPPSPPPPHPVQVPPPLLPRRRRRRRASVSLASLSPRRARRKGSSSQPARSTQPPPPPPAQSLPAGLPAAKTRLPRRRRNEQSSRRSSWRMAPLAQRCGREP